VPLKHALNPSLPTFKPLGDAMTSMAVVKGVNFNGVTGYINTKRLQQTSTSTAFVLVVFDFFGTHSAVLVQLSLVVFMVRIGHVYC
jgi:hypothetical protein